MGYGLAADRGAAAMHHEARSGAPLRPIERIRKAEIEGAMLDAIRVKLLARHRVEPLRRLPVALFDLRPEPTRPQANGISGEANEATIFLNPKLELRFELEDAQVNRRAELCTLRRQCVAEKLSALSLATLRLRRFDRHPSPIRRAERIEV